MAPMYLGYAGEAGSVSNLLLEHYRSMVGSGVAMVVVENATVEYPRGSRERRSPRFFTSTDPNLGMSVSGILRVTRRNSASTARTIPDPSCSRKKSVIQSHRARQAYSRFNLGFPVLTRGPYSQFPALLTPKRALHNSHKGLCTIQLSPVLLGHYVAVQDLPNYCKELRNLQWLFCHRIYARFDSLLVFQGLPSPSSQ